MILILVVLELIVELRVGKLCARVLLDIKETPMRSVSVETVNMIANAPVASLALITIVEILVLEHVDVMQTVRFEIIVLSAPVLRGSPETHFHPATVRLLLEAVRPRPLDKNLVKV